ncbi:hypothetical protein [Paracidobacterium acidisoli]|uniref:Uncharacterized protein n=1 Tax=Paracidobacterium acidisoli TaxID=2303751 RepID=A0A372IL71_9BACT|nr:hypothetical protein [Paracidobacterium acidisoli]MBT9332302.1 hypothetical protein [Paracidobacterium acidisoli]
MADSSETKSIPQVHAEEIRRLIHDLGNALEIVLQTSFLLGTVEMDESAKQWRGMLDQGVRQAAQVNSQLRDYLLSHTQS